MSGSFKVAQVWLSIGYGIYKFSTFPLNIYEKSAAVLNTVSVDDKTYVCMLYVLLDWLMVLVVAVTDNVVARYILSGTLAKKKEWLNEIHILLYISIVLLLKYAEQLHIPYFSFSFG